MDGFRICLALSFIYMCDCDQWSETTLSLTTKLAIIRGLGMSPTSRFRKSGRGDVPNKPVSQIWPEAWFGGTEHLYIQMPSLPVCNKWLS